jgi:arylsulfatase A-like enzyme
MKRATRPNVILIMCDQWRHDCAGFAGHAAVQTPHLDRLAARGVVFDNAYCASPLCVPARASWLTGLYPHAHGQLRNCKGNRTNAPGSVMRPECRPIGDVLSACGYRCGIVGPRHLGTDDVPQHGFEKFWCTCRHRSDPPDRLGAYFQSQSVIDLHQRGAPGVIDEGLKLRYGIIDDPRQQRTTGTVDRGLEFIAEPGKRPFFLFLSVKDPPPPMLVPPELLGLYPPQNLKLPASWADPLEGKPSYQHDAPGRIAASIDASTFQRIMAHYYAVLIHIDEQLGRLFDALRDGRIERDTIVVFVSDHGEMLGDHGFEAKTVMYESAVRVPLVICCPDVLPGGFLVGAPLGGGDLFPTLLELADVPFETEIDGHSVTKALAEGHQPEPRPILAEICTGSGGRDKSDDEIDLAARVMLIDEWLKPVHSRDDEDELYDLANDPDEMVNLASDPKRQNARRRLQSRIADILRRAGPGLYEWCA